MGNNKLTIRIRTKLNCCSAEIKVKTMTLIEILKSTKLWQQIVKNSFKNPLSRKQSVSIFTVAPNSIRLTVFFTFFENYDTYSKNSSFIEKLVQIYDKKLGPSIIFRILNWNFWVTPYSKHIRLLFSFGLVELFIYAGAKCNKENGPLPQFWPSKGQ